jgi:hypothetical protein
MDLLWVNKDYVILPHKTKTVHAGETISNGSACGRE